jgi:hypothetical protein
MGSCNPLIYDKMLKDVYVSNFNMRGPGGTPTHSRVEVVYPADEKGEGHLLMAAVDDASMVNLSLSAGGDPKETYPNVDVLTALVFPIEGVQKVKIGGLVEVPPAQGRDEPHALAAFQAPGAPDTARVVRFRADTWSRSDNAEDDMVNPIIDGTPLPIFGTGLGAINMDGDADDPDYEVATGSQEGVVVYDNLGKNREAYEAAADAMPPASCEGDNAPDCYGFTLCTDVGLPNNITQGPFLPGGEPAFVASHEAGLTLIGAPDGGAENAVGAPIFNCAAGFIDAPEGLSPGLGAELFVSDLDNDGTLDLAVGDPTANVVYTFLNDGADGLPSTPTRTITPFEDAMEFGYSIGRADLGAPIGSVLLVGAPGSAVDSLPEVGKTFVFDIEGRELLEVLADETPEKNTRFGIWAGGIYVGDRDELVVVGISEAKVHVAINADDPFPG